MRLKIALSALWGASSVVISQAAAAQVATGQATTEAQIIPSGTATTARSADGNVADETADTGDILVTARRRSERSLDVPVAITAFSGKQLDQAGVVSLSDIGRLTPQLTIEPNVGSYGGAITLRGIASPTSNSPSEPAVTINIDGVPVTTGSAVRLGQLDLGSVEVLKGPQALFFGKNAIGGIISLRSAEPSQEFESLVRAGYETNARQLDLEAMLSAPLNDTIGIRFAVRRSAQRGYLVNDVATAQDRNGPGTRTVTAGGSLVFRLSESFHLKLKGIYDQQDENGSWFITQRIACPAGVPSGSTASSLYPDCMADDHVTRGDLPANAAAASGDAKFRDGVPYSMVRQYLGIANANYAGIESVEIDSITGYYNLRTQQADNNSDSYIPALFSSGVTRKRSLTEEVRISSATPGSPFTWMIGGFYEDDHVFDSEHVGITTPAGVIYRPEVAYSITDQTLSGFVQAGYRLGSFNLSAGARYTDEHKRQSVNISTKFIPEIHFDDISPELTLSYKPVMDTNIYVSYKEAYQAGGFQVGSLNFLAAVNNPLVTSIDNSYDKENVRGFEGGIKTLLLNKSLRLDLAIYDYIYRGLQLSSYDPTLNVTRISNAASAKVSGVEGSFSYSPPSLSALRFNGALAYNRARYRNFVAACYVGQTIAEGCTIDSADADTVPDQQNLSGRPLLRAPTWAGNLGFTLDHQVSKRVNLSINGQAIYQSKAFLSQELLPYGISPSRVTFDGGVALRSSTNGWELAFIGKNLTDKRFGVSGFQVPFTGSAATTGTTAGVLPDFGAVVNRGRELWLRLTLRPNRL